MIKASTVVALSPVGVPGLRVLEVLTTAGDSLVVDDRPDSLTIWIEDQFAGLPPRMREELQTWIDVLREGNARRRPRPRRTVFSRLSSIRPFLVEFARYDTLRHVTYHDVIGWLDGRKDPANDAHALRDLFRTLKARRLVFTNPTSRVHVGSPNQTTPSALSPAVLRQLGEAARTDPALRVVLALIGVHALFPHQARGLLLDQVDLPNHRIGLDGGDRTLDPFTADAIAAYLDYRHHRWPDTSNPHLLLTRRTAHEQGPVSEYWLSSLFRDLPTTLRQLREDRILEEAAITGGDPLHLAVMFDLGTRAGMRYAYAGHPELAHRQGEPNPPVKDRP
jgi:hypothetical protein